VTEIAERVDRATRRTELAEVKFAPERGQLMVPTDGKQLMDMANLMSNAGFMVKDTYRGNAGACMGLIMVCAPYGLNPFQVSWKTYQTKPDAPIAYEAQVIVAMLNASGALNGPLDYELRGEGATRQCVVTGELRSGGGPRTLVTPTIGQITTKNSPLWKSDPDQQLCYYGGRAWVRRFKPEMLLGIHDVDEPMTPAGPEHARDITPHHDAPSGPRRGKVIYREPEPAPEVDAILEHHVEADDGPSAEDRARAEAEALAAIRERDEVPE
jgi:hypothetical protein